MKAAQFACLQVADIHRLSEAAMTGLSDEQFNWLPSGTLNPIKSIYLHTLAGEDMFFQKVIRGGQTLWSTGGWDARVGVAQPPAGPRGWDEARNTSLALASVREYAEAVCGATDEYMAGLTDDELDREVTLFGRTVSVAVALALFASHTAGHAGEIAAIKGMQGMQGLPY
jgi:hypothetical protein